MEKVGKEEIGVGAVSNLFHIASIVSQWQTVKATFITDGMLSTVTIGLWLPGVHQSLHFSFLLSLLLRPSSWKGRGGLESSIAILT